MIEIKTKLRKWGNSFGVVVPQGEVKKFGVAEGDNVIILLKKEKEDNILKEMFGILKTKKSTDKIMKEINRDLDIDI